MTTIEIAFIATALAMALAWAFMGWSSGIVSELRRFFILFFAMFCALRFWHPVAKFFQQTLLDPTAPAITPISATVAFALLFVSTALLAATAVNVWEKPAAVKGVKTAASSPGRLVSALLGFVSGLVFSCLLILVTSVALSSGTEPVATPRTLSSRLHALPIAVFRFVERTTTGASESDASATSLPKTDKADGAPALEWSGPSGS